MLANRFVHASSEGSTKYGGIYINGERRLRVWLRSGQGDVFADLNGSRIVAECKGGVFNSQHSGVLSKLRKNLREAVGALLERGPGERNIAVVPKAPETTKFASRMAERAAKVGVEIALVSEFGDVTFVTPDSPEAAL